MFPLNKLPLSFNCFIGTSFYLMALFYAISAILRESYPCLLDFICAFPLSSALASGIAGRLLVVLAKVQRTRALLDRKPSVFIRRHRTWFSSSRILWLQTAAIILSIVIGALFAWNQSIDVTVSGYCQMSKAQHSLRSYASLFIPVLMIVTMFIMSWQLRRAADDDGGERKSVRLGLIWALFFIVLMMTLSYALSSYYSFDNYSMTYSLVMLSSGSLFFLKSAVFPALASLISHIFSASFISDSTLAVIRSFREQAPPLSDGDRRFVVCMQEQRIFAAFALFCAREFSVESLLCWFEVQRWRSKWQPGFGELDISIPVSLAAMSPRAAMEARGDNGSPDTVPRPFQQHQLPVDDLELPSARITPIASPRYFQHQQQQRGNRAQIEEARTLVSDFLPLLNLPSALTQRLHDFCGVSRSATPSLASVRGSTTSPGDILTGSARVSSSAVLDHASTMINTSGTASPMAVRRVDSLMTDLEEQLVTLLEADSFRRFCRQYPAMVSIV